MYNLILSMQYKRWHFRTKLYWFKSLEVIFLWFMAWEIQLSSNAHCIPTRITTQVPGSCSDYQMIFKLRGWVWSVNYWFREEITYECKISNKSNHFNISKHLFDKYDEVVWLQSITHCFHKSSFLFKYFYCQCILCFVGL